MNDRGDTSDRTQNRNRPGSGLYVDVENLQSDGQQLIETLVKDWPETTPRPSRLTLYVKADTVELWRLWAMGHFEYLEVAVKGIQHFAYASKNSADIAIATNAMADFVCGRVSHVVVFSDDSDFISLYIAMRDEIDQAQKYVPFLWVVTDRQHSLSATIKRFFPSDKLHVVAVEGGDAKTSSESAREPWAEIIQNIVQQIPVGPFKSTECQGIIRKSWPQHSMATAEGAAFGVEFKKSIWPALEAIGVKIANPGKKPVRYEMTEDAKNRSL